MLQGTGFSSGGYPTHAWQNSVHFTNATTSGIIFTLKAYDGASVNNAAKIRVVVYGY
jgi:hypothetical protein